MPALSAVPNPEPSGFDALWTLYPRHVAKKDAIKAWNRLTPAQQQQAIIACAQWRRVWLADELRYVPYPATWLNGWRFEDELPPECRVSAACHVAFAQQPQPVERTELPEDVRAQLRRLTGKA